MEKISFVIPCYNSSKTLGGVVSEIELTMQNLSYQYEIILVNDSSPDDTLQTIKNLAKKDNVIGIDLAKNFGQHAALMAGFHFATGDIVVCMDDDGQTPANEVNSLISKIKEGYDVVYAKYPSKKHSGFRNFGSKINAKMAEVMIHKPKNLSVTSYFAMKKFVMLEMIKYENCYPYVIGLVLRTTKNICNVEINHRERQSGKSGYTLGKLISLWVNGFTSFSVKPLRIATFLGILSSFCGFGYLIFIILNYFINKSAPLGYSSIMIVMLILGGLILIVLGLIGEYVGRIYMCNNAAPQYVVREIIDKDNQAGAKDEK